MEFEDEIDDNEFLGAAVTGLPSWMENTCTFGHKPIHPPWPSHEWQQLVVGEPMATSPYGYNNNWTDNVKAEWLDPKLLRIAFAKECIGAYCMKSTDSKGKVGYRLLSPPGWVIDKSLPVWESEEEAWSFCPAYGRSFDATWNGLDLVRRRLLGAKIRIEWQITVGGAGIVTFEIHAIQEMFAFNSSKGSFKAAVNWGHLPNALAASLLSMVRKGMLQP